VPPVSILRPGNHQASQSLLLPLFLLFNIRPPNKQWVPHSSHSFIVRWVGDHETKSLFFTNPLDYSYL